MSCFFLCFKCTSFSNVLNKTPYSIEIEIKIDRSIDRSRERGCHRIDNIVVAFTSTSACNQFISSLKVVSLITSNGEMYLIHVSEYLSLNANCSPFC